MGKSANIICIDDDTAILELIASLMEAEGHTVTTLSDPNLALAAVKEQKPDCVILDLMMPGLDGLQLCQRLRAEPDLEGLKIVVVSGKAYEFDRRRAFEFGADGYIVKPINTDTFADEVCRLLKDDIELTFWGVRGTLPVPGERSLRYGGNTNCVTLEFAKGEMLIFDAGSGIKALSDSLLAAKRSRIEAKILISHPHWDHINALPFFVPLYMQGNEFEIMGADHGDLSVRELISAQMDGVYFPVTIKEFGARVYFRDLKEGSYNINGITVKTMLLSHPGACMGYRIEYEGRSVCYITDNEMYAPDDPLHNPHYAKKLTAFIEGADALIVDSTYTDAEYQTKVGWGHSSISQVVDLAHGATVKNLYLYHHDPDQDDDAIDAKLATAQAMLRDRESTVICHAPHEGLKIIL